MELKQSLKPIFQWGSKGKGLFFTPAKLSKFLGGVGVEVSPDILEEYLKANSFHANAAATEYFIGFKGPYDAKARAFCNLPVPSAPVVSPAPFSKWEAYMKPEYKEKVLAYFAGHARQ